MMTEAIHDTSVQIDVFPDEFIPLLKVINCALLMPEKFALTDKEIETLHNFQVDFRLSAFEHGK
jgi:hypothetical protein